jgi:hypothetical protein
MMRLAGRLFLVWLLCTGATTKSTPGRKTKSTSSKSTAERIAYDSDKVKKSRAKDKLRDAAAQRVLNEDQNQRPGCEEQQILKVNVLTKPKKDGIWQERWFVRACGNSVPYRVTFLPDEKSALKMKVNVALDEGKYGFPTN